MFFKKVTYEDYNGNERTDKLYFHLSKIKASRMRANNFSEDSKMGSIFQRFLNMRKEDLNDEDKVMSRIPDVIDFIDYLIKESYGIKSEDGTRFRQSDEITKEFMESMAYEAFITSLLEPTGDDLTNFFSSLFYVNPDDMKKFVSERNKQLPSPK